MKRTMTMIVVLALAATAYAQPAATQPAQGVALTVYNGGYGVVRETRNVDIAPNGEVKFTDVASAIDATTVHFKSLTDPAAKLNEQNYQFDLISADQLLNKYIDKPIDVVVTGKTYSGTLLSFDAAQVVIKEDSGITMIQRADNIRDIRFKVLPEGLLTRPTLVWLVATDKPGKQLVEVTYQTGALNWHAEYVMVLNGDDTAADLTGWVSVQNNSGKLYKDARMKFIAGDVRRVQPEPMAPMSAMRKGKGDYAGQPAMEEKAFFEYHMYTLKGASSVANNEVKQLEMFTPIQGMKVEKKYLYDPMSQYRWFGSPNMNKSYDVTSPKKVNIFIEFKNSKESNLGLPLPAGKVRVYKQDPADKALEFVGEEQIDHTAVEEKLSLEVGNAFDVFGEWKQTDFQIDNNRHWMKETIEVKLHNSKKENITVRLKQPMHRTNNWKITDKSAEFIKLDAFHVAWDVPVESQKDAVVTYTVEYTW